MPITSNSLAYIAKTKAYKPEKAAYNFTNCEKKVPFLWGDEVYVISTNRSKTKISAKGHHFKIDTKDLMPDSILCMWQIDCGQGDAAFVRFPNGKTMMVDAGPGPMMSNSPAQAPSFLYWMRYVDQSWRDEFGFGGKKFYVDAVVISHPDYDHYGGFLDMLDKLKRKQFKFGTVYHNGLGRFNCEPKGIYRGKGMGQLGPVSGTNEPDLFLTTLLDNFADVRKLAKTSRGRNWKLTGSYATLLRGLEELEGKGVTGLASVHSGMDELPHFDAGSNTKVNVLGPVYEPWKGKPAVRFLDGPKKSNMKKPSLTRNGVSVVLRIDYDHFRLLMTGDLNFRSQAVLLHHIPAIEFKCHVAKACHHGSGDVSKTFLQAMSPKATLFSSGDNESHAHPRAKVLGMAGAFSMPTSESKTTRFMGLEERKHESPLIYSTELSRSIKLFDPGKLHKDGDRITDATLESKGANGRKGPGKKVTDWLLADSLIYGLVNVRTDGRKVVIGVLKEDPSRPGFQTETFTV